MTKYNQRGFSPIVLLLLIALLLAAIAFAGLNVYNNRQNKKSSFTPGKTTKVDKKTPSPGPKTAAVRVSPTTPTYAVTLPDSWVDGRCADNPDILFLAPSSDLLGKCQTESFGMVAVSVSPGDQRKTEESYMADDYYGAATFESATIDGLPGYKVTYTVATETELGYPPVGTYESSYILYDAPANKSYIIGYRQFAGNPDHKADFTTIAESFARL